MPHYWSTLTNTETFCIVSDSFNTDLVTVVLLLSVLLLVSSMNVYSILHAFVISVIDC